VTNFAKGCFFVRATVGTREARERERAWESDFVLYQVSINVIGSNDFYGSSNKVKSAELINIFLCTFY